MTTTDQQIEDGARLAVRKKDDAFAVVLTFPDGREVDLSMIALTDGFAITGFDDPVETREITLSCKLVITELDIDIDVLRARMVDAAGADLSLDDLAALTDTAGGA